MCTNAVCVHGGVHVTHCAWIHMIVCANLWRGGVHACACIPVGECTPASVCMCPVKPTEVEKRNGVWQEDSCCGLGELNIAIDWAISNPLQTKSGFNYCSALT